jgi:pimeloyl-ACP methyl ester carboxylesterase
VLVVPGNTGDGFPFAPLLPHRDLVRYTVSTVLDSLGIDRVPIVAHSMGGHWSQPFAMDRRPESMTGCT